jgi:MFS family permease
VLSILALFAVNRARDDATGAVAPAASTGRRVDHDASLSKHLLVVSAPFAPWVFGTAAIALAYLPALVADRAGSHPLTFAAVATAIPALAGVIVQPLATRLRPSAGTGLLTPTMLIAVGALIVAVWAASAATVWAVLIAAAVLGAAYGVTQFAGLADIQRVAEPARLGVATSAYQALSYLGFAVPYLLTLGHAHLGWSPVTGLSVVSAVAVVSLLWLTVSGRRGRARVHAASSDSYAPI